MFSKMKDFATTAKRKCLSLAVGATSVMMLSVPSFAADVVDPLTGVIDPTAFDPLVSSVTGNVAAALPKVVVVVGLLLGLGVVIALFRRNARPTN